MSHHLDTPLARQNGQLYLDDLCVFPANGSTVFVMDVNSTITESNVQPGFHPEAGYEFKVHFDGAAFEDLTYRVSFDERGSDGRQNLKLHVLNGDEAREDSAIGELVVEGRTDAAAGNGDVRIWAGRITDWFYIDLSVLFKINAAVKDGAAPDLSECGRSSGRTTPSSTTRLTPGIRRRTSTRSAATSQTRSRRLFRRSGPPRTRMATARPWLGRCFPTSCRTWSERPRLTGSPASTAGRWPTTHQRQCCLSSSTQPCPRG